MDKRNNKNSQKKGAKKKLVEAFKLLFSKSSIKKDIKIFFIIIILVN